MGIKKSKQLLILSLILLITGFLANQNDVAKVVEKTKGLKYVLSAIEGYEKIEEVVVSDYLISALKLDDVSQQKYVKEGKVIELYAGYYFSIDKLSAAHSPLVCMPGQGWVLGNLTERSLSLGLHTINHAVVTASQGEQQILLMYWFQAYNKSAPNMYVNIYNALLNAFKAKPPEHAFVRVSIPLVGMSRTEAEIFGEDFIRRFYPAFIEYIKDQA